MNENYKIMSKFIKDISGETPDLETYLFVKDFNKRIKENIKTIKKLPKIKGVKEIVYPGQNKYKRFKTNSKKEIKISDITKKDLDILRS